MWKSRNSAEEERSPKTEVIPPSIPSATVTKPAAPVMAPPQKEVRPVEAIVKGENFRADVAHIGKSVVIKGELSASEDLYLDGEVEGSIELREHSLIVGPHGRVRANVHSRDIVVHGKVDGNVSGTERVELKKSAILNGDISTQRIVIEDGAFFKGSIDIQKDAIKPKKIEREVTASTSTAGAYTPVSSSSVGV